MREASPGGSVEGAGEQAQKPQCDQRDGAEERVESQKQRRHSAASRTETASMVLGAPLRQVRSEN